MKKKKGKLCYDKTIIPIIVYFGGRMSSLKAMLDKKKKARFVGREYEVSEFMQELSMHDFEDHRIFSYYGIGGVGKTEFSKELQRRINPLSKYRFTSINFEIKKHRTMEEALIFMRQELGKKYKMPFTLFDIAYVIYLKNIDPKTVINEKSIPFIEESSIIMEIISATSGVTMISIPKIIELVYRRMDKLLNASRREMIEDFKNMDNIELFELLPYIFAEDIRAYIEKHHSHFIFFLDAYEALWEEKREHYDVDHWIRILVEAMPYSVWVITGREPLDWIQYEDEWKDLIIPIPLDNLSDTETFHLCSSLGVGDSEIQHVIYENSGGHPFSITLAIDLYKQIKDSGRKPEVSDFIDQKTPQKLVKRLLLYITNSEKQLLEYLALANTWNISLFHAVVSNFRIFMNEENHQNITQFSFIREIGENQWEMHQLMRKCLKHTQSEEKLSKGHNFLHMYYKNQLHKDLIYSDPNYASSILHEAFYHGYQLVGMKEFNKKEFIDWFRKLDEKFLNSGKNYLTLPMLETLIDDLEKSNDEIKLEYLPILIYDLAYIHMWELLNYDEAERLFKEALQLRLNYYGENHLYTAKSYYGLATLYHRQGKKDRSEELYIKSLDIRERLCGEGDNIAVALSANGLAKLYQDNGDYEKAEELYKRSLEIRLSQVNMNYEKIVLAKNNLISCYQEMGKYELATELIDEVLTIIKEHLSSQKLEWHKAQTYLAILTAKDKHFEKAISILDEVEEYYKNYYGENHIRVGDILHNKALIYALRNETILAIDFMEKAIEIKSRINGLNKAFDKRIGFKKSTIMLEYIKLKKLAYEDCKFDF